MAGHMCAHTAMTSQSAGFRQMLEKFLCVSVPASLIIARRRGRINSFCCVALRGVPDLAISAALQVSNVMFSKHPVRVEQTSRSEPTQTSARPFDFGA